MNTSENYYVGVTYDSNYPTDGIWVCWIYVDVNGNKEFPIGIKCDNSAVPVTGTTYWEAPKGTLQSDDAAFCMSIAGRYGSDELFLTYAAYQIAGTTIDDIYIKNITSAGSATSFRHISDLEIPVDFDIYEEQNMYLYDISGKLIMNKRMNYNEFNSFIKHDNNLPASIYIAQFINDKGKQIINKFFLEK